LASPSLIQLPLVRPETIVSLYDFVCWNVIFCVYDSLDSAIQADG